MNAIAAPLDRLEATLAALDTIACAVSGGVDSLTLATVAGRWGGADVRMFHAVSAAVPPLATVRVKTLAAQEGWKLEIVTPGELAQESYVANPVDRCLHCKRALYSAIAAITRHTSVQIVSGANLDDLDDYRPGLRAASDAGVRHPFVEARINKVEVREIARALGLGDIAELPASPCLSSRMETGIRISAEMLRRIDLAEQEVRAVTQARNVRCRVRHSGVVVEVDRETLESLGGAERERVLHGVHRIFSENVGPAPTMEAYRLGSAFLRLPSEAT